MILWLKLKEDNLGLEYLLGRQTPPASMGRSLLQMHLFSWQIFSPLPSQSMSLSHSNVKLASVVAKFKSIQLNAVLVAHGRPLWRLQHMILMMIRVHSLCWPWISFSKWKGFVSSWLWLLLSGKNRLIQVSFISFIIIHIISHFKLRVCTRSERVAVFVNH